MVLFNYLISLFLFLYVWTNQIQSTNSIVINIDKDVLKKIKENNLNIYVKLNNPNMYITIDHNILENIEANKLKNLPNKIIYQTYKMAPKKTIKTKSKKNNNKTQKRKQKKGKKGRDVNKKHNHKQQSKIGKHIIKVANTLKTTDTCSINSDGLGFTCYSKPILFKIKETWNKKHPKHKITSEDPYIIWKSLRSVMEHEHACKRESCWLKHLCIKEGLPSNIYDLTFSPEMPESWLKNPNEWLSSLDIVKVMNQWEERYKCFKFIGPSPIDYDTHKMFGECVWDELCKFNLKNHLKNKKKKIGIIFNLDPHYKSGSHWVAVFINDIKKTIYYFDSYGDKPDTQIKKFIDGVINQSTQLGTTYRYLENKRRHQFGNSECGMYSMYFITQMLQNKCFEKFQNKQVTDAYMLRLRKKFFNKPV